MKKYFTLVIALAFGVSLSAQFDQIPVGPGYINQSFYNLNSGSTVESPHTAWDIAFSTNGFDAGIFINEGQGSSMGMPLPGFELYLSENPDYEIADTTGMSFIQNNEVSWNEGAFNIVNDPTDPFDFGWGTYDAVNHSTNGTRLFFAKLRTGSYKKVFINSLVSGTYTFKHADLDGQNEVEVTINKADYADKTLIYYSIENDEIINIEPNSWDLQFTRYISELDDGSGGKVNYFVTGVLSNDGVEIAQADGIDPYNVNYLEYESLYSDSLDIIGHDWKSFSLNTFSWELVEDRVYFVKTASDSLWRVRLIDFEGSSTGITTLEKTFETEVTSVKDFDTSLSYFRAYPNPSKGDINIAFETVNNAKSGKVTLVDNLGKVAATYGIQAHAGLNLKNLRLNVPPGLYNMVIKLDGANTYSQKIVIQ